MRRGRGWLKWDPLQQVPFSQLRPGNKAQNLLVIKIGPKAHFNIPLVQRIPFSVNISFKLLFPLSFNSPFSQLRPFSQPSFHPCPWWSYPAPWWRYPKPPAASPHAPGRVITRPWRYPAFLPALSHAPGGVTPRGPGVITRPRCVILPPSCVIPAPRRFIPLRSLRCSRRRSRSHPNDMAWRLVWQRVP